MPPAPSGNTSAAAQAYFRWLYTQYLAAIPSDRTQILWSGPFWLFFFLVILTLFVYLYARYLFRVQRQRGEMYGVMSFAGSILERIGEVSIFFWAISIAVVLWALFIIITHVIWGQIY